MWLTANSTCNLHAIICFDGGAKCFDIHIVFLKSSVSASSFQSSCDSNQFICPVVALVYQFCYLKLVS